MMSALVIFLVATFTCPANGFGVTVGEPTEPACTHSGTRTSFETKGDLKEALENLDLTGSPEDVNAWDVSKITDMGWSGEILVGPTFNLDIRCWDTSAVTNMDRMFAYATAFNQNINSWNTGAVTNMFKMFYHAKAFNQPLDSWDTSAVTNMEFMFYEANAFNQSLDVWNTGKVTYMFEMFKLSSGSASWSWSG